MKKSIYAFVLALFIPISLCGCSHKEDMSSKEEQLHLYDYEQTPAHLGINTGSLPEPELAYKPINYTPQYAMWFTAMDYPEILMTKTEDEFTAEIEKRFDNAAGLGINTVYVQVRAFGDAYYESSLYSQGLYAPADMDFDPLEIMTDSAHERKLSIHAWINPLRCQSDVQMQAMEDRFTLKKWYDDEEKNGTYLSLIDGRWWLCPAYEEVREFIAAGAEEIVRNYDVDGIHIDDYFYPTADTGFDDEAFAKSEMQNLTEFRKEQCSLMVKGIYDAVKSVNPDVLFGISPQGTLTGNASQYSDAERWCSEEDFCDYIVPQIYFGFRNESAPFTDMLSLWKGLVTNPDTELVIGICTYKTGKEDAFAGSGKDEWINDTSVSSKELALVKDSGLGAAVYSYASTFEPEEFADIMEKEREAMENILKRKNGDTVSHTASP